MTKNHIFFEVGIFIGPKPKDPVIRFMRVSFLFTLGVLFVSEGASPASTAPNSQYSNWSYPGYDPGNTNFDPDVINASNLQYLQIKR